MRSRRSWWNWQTRGMAWFTGQSGIFYQGGRGHCGLFHLILIGWFIKLSVRKFQPLILIYWRDDYAYQYWGCTSIYRPLSYSFRFLGFPKNGIFRNSHNKTFRYYCNIGSVGRFNLPVIRISSRLIRVLPLLPLAKIQSFWQKSGCIFVNFVFWCIFGNIFCPLSKLYNLYNTVLLSFSCPWNSMRLPNS